MTPRRVRQHGQDVDREHPQYQLAQPRQRRLGPDLLTYPGQLLAIRLALGTKALELLALDGVAPSQGLQRAAAGRCWPSGS